MAYEQGPGRRRTGHAELWERAHQAKKVPTGLHACFSFLLLIEVKSYKINYLKLYNLDR